MAYINNLDIITSNGRLVYKDVDSLNINLNRIADDMNKISNRFADFSYSFDLPIVKENSLVFGFADTIGINKIFTKNKNIPCQVYLNNELLLDGLINLIGVTKNSYRCVFFSKFKELIDTLNENDANNENKTLRSLQFPVIQNWVYEKSIINHINTYGDLDSDSTTHQFPITFYSTFYCQESYYSGSTDMNGNYFEADRDKQNYYYLLNSIAGNDNRMYVHQIPPAIYIVSIVEQILSDAGWKLGGQFFNDSNVKKIVLLYAGEDDIYDQATERVSGSTAVNLQIAKFLPEWSQSDFLKEIINYFNLYFKIDVNNKVINFETYDTFFNNVTVNPYDITEKVMLNTMSISYVENNNPSFYFDNAENQNIMGDNYVMSGLTNNAYSTVWITGNTKTFDNTFNRVGTTDSIDFKFSAPTVKRHIIYNNYNQAGVSKSAGMHYFYLPLMSKQTMNSNNGMKFNKKKTDTYLFNNESSIKFDGSPCLMYHYGFPTTDTENKTGKGSLSDYLYVNIYTGSTINRTKMTICSPFQLQTYRDDINDWLSNITVNNVYDRRTAVATYLQALWQLMDKSTGIPDSKLTDFSLVFDDNGYFHDTLWSKFHFNKWYRYQNSQLLTIQMRMNAYDWQQMQIDRTIRFNQELYNIVSIDGYNPIKRVCNLKLIKKI